MDILLIGNDHTLEVTGLQDELSPLSYLNAATVTARIKNTNDSDVTGETWPITLSYVAASNGNYRGNISDAIAFLNGAFYIVEITADAGSGLLAFWRKEVVAQYRTF